MLILNRKVNESIVLNEVIKITVLDIEPGKVKLGIDAPPDVIIVREELLTRGAVPTPAPADNVAGVCRFRNGAGDDCVTEVDPSGLATHCLTHDTWGPVATPAKGA